MALIKCSECGKKISDKAKECIHCGCPIEFSNSKKLSCPKCGEEVKSSDKFCENCGSIVNGTTPIPKVKEEKIAEKVEEKAETEESIKKVEKKIKKDIKKEEIIYENLTKQQIKQVEMYRKHTSQYYTGSRVINLILFIVAMFAFFFVFFTLGISFLVYVICLIICRLILLPKIQEEDKMWFKANLDKLLEQNILDINELDYNRIKNYDELNQYDLVKIKGYRKIHNEYNTKTRTLCTAFFVLLIINIPLALLLIFIPVLIFAIIMTNIFINKVKEEDKEWYLSNRERLYDEHQLPFK